MIGRQKEKDNMSREGFKMKTEEKSISIKSSTSDPFTRRYFTSHSHTQTLVHTGSFAHRHFDIQMLLYKDAFTHRCFYTRAPLHTDTFTHRRFCIQTPLQRHFCTQTLVHSRFYFYTKTLLRTDAFTHKRFYTQTLLHTDTFTHKHFYTQTLSQPSVLDTNAWRHTNAHTHRWIDAPTRTHTQTHAHADRRTRTHTHRHTHTEIHRHTKWDRNLGGSTSVKQNHGAALHATAVWAWQSAAKT